MREAIKRSGEAALVASGLPWLGRRLRRHRALVLAYHNVVPDGWLRSGDVSLHLPVGRLARQLDSLVLTHRVVPLDDLLEEEGRSQGAGGDGPPRAAVTFDDAYRGAVRLGVREVVRRGLPATIFVVPGFVGGGPFWWDLLATGDGGGAFEELRRRALEEWGGAQEVICRRARELGFRERSGDPDIEPATEEELREAARLPGIALGSHTWTHFDLRTLTGKELEEELGTSLAWLRERFEVTVPWLSYPYGAYSASVEEAAREAGYRAAVRIDGGWLPWRRRGEFSLPRLNIPAGLSVRGFLLKTAGFFCG